MSDKPHGCQTPVVQRNHRHRRKTGKACQAAPNAVYAPCQAAVTPIFFRWKLYAEKERSLRTHGLHTPGEPTSPASLRLQGTGGRRGRRITAATVMTAGLLLAPGLMTSAGAASMSHAVADSTATDPTCLAGVHNTYEFYTWCKGTSPASYRTIAYCNDNEAVLGIEYADGSGNLSYGDCSGTAGLNAALGGAWGVLWCTNDDGTGTYAGYKDLDTTATNSISQLLVAAGGGSSNANAITQGGTALCQSSYDLQIAVSQSTGS